MKDTYDAYSSGLDAARTGIPYDANPHPSGPLQIDWSEGWIDAAFYGRGPSEEARRMLAELHGKEYIPTAPTLPPR